MTKIRINEIFTSIDGEVNRWKQGGITTFIRFAGCSLDCDYCDTTYAADKEAGKEMKVADVVNQIRTPKATITGGEPLEQMDSFKELLTALACFHFVTVETNGAHSVPFRQFAAGRFKDRVGWVIDYKIDKPDKMHMPNFSTETTQNDWVKIVVRNIVEYREAVRVFKQLRTELGCLANFAISTTHPALINPLVKWLVADQIYDITVNVQIHKLAGLK